MRSAVEKLRPCRKRQANGHKQWKSAIGGPGDAGIRRSDGRLKNSIVTADSLDESLLIGLKTPTVWKTSIRYIVLDCVTVYETGIQGVYRCVVSHESADFSDDLAAGYWELIFALSPASLGFASAAQGLLAEGAAQKAQNLADLANLGTAQDNVQLGASFLSVAAAIAATIPARNKRLRTQFHTPLFATPSTLFGGGSYRRISFADLAGVPAQAYFRSSDRFLPDGTTHATNGGYWLLDEREVDWRMLGVKADGTDDTSVAQAAINFCMLDTNRTLKMTGTVYASKLAFTGATNARVIGDNCVLVANSAAAQTCLLEIKVPNFSTEGRLAIIVGYRTNYECAVWFWHETAAQFSSLRNIIPNTAKIGIRVGNIAYPSALISELLIENAQSYGCPVCMEIVGGETYVDVSSSMLWASGVGGDAAWIAMENIVIRNIGASVNVSGGECVITGSTNGVVHEMQPINRGGGRVEWGSTIFDTVFCETASPLSRTANPGGLTINNSASNRRGLIQFSNPLGFHSQELVALIATDASYDDFIVVDNPAMWKPGAIRTQPNIFCAAGSLAEVTVRGNFGPGFIKGMTGISGGIVNFESTVVCRALNLAGQAFTAASGAQAALFQNKDLADDRARFGGYYNPATGEFTVPPGGLQDVALDVALRMTGTASGTIIIFSNGGELQRKAFSGGVGDIRTVPQDMAAGTVLKVMVDIDTNDTGSAVGYLNTMAITARHR